MPERDDVPHRCRASGSFAAIVPGGSAARLARARRGLAWVLAFALAGCAGSSGTLVLPEASTMPRASATNGATDAADAIDAALDGLRGDPARGRRIVTSRQKGLCLLCHSGPFPEERFQGDLAPDLAGVGARLSEGQLRARIVDARRSNPATIMPSYRRTDGFERVGRAWAGRALLDAQEVEDVVAFLATLRDASPGTRP